MARVHLEGLGIMGCYLALRLANDGCEFTWHDTNERVTAWRASTGAIFPTGHADDMAALHTWTGHLTQPDFARFMEEASYVFCTKAPPHGGRYGFEDLGPVKVADHHSLHLNAQRWVPHVREMFRAAQRSHGELGGIDVRIITHGFGPRLARYMWGWTVPVRIRCKQEWPLRQALYFRRGRFQMAYAYPIPGTDMWYAGSSLISQRTPNTLAVEAKYLRWRDLMYELSGGYVQGIARAGLPTEGWRPVPAKGDDEWVKRMPDGSLACRSLWHSGIRHAPLVYNALKEVL